MSVASSSDESKNNYREIDSFESLQKNINLYSGLAKLSSRESYLYTIYDMIFVENKDVYADGWDHYINELSYKEGGGHNKTKQKRPQVKDKRKRLTKKCRYSSRSVR